MRRRLIGFATGVAIGAIAFMPHAVAEQWITQTGCEPTLIDGVWRPKVSFEVRNVGAPSNYSVFWMFAIPYDSSGAGGECRALRSEAPETWATYIQEDNGHVLWGRTSEDSATLNPGEVLGGLALVPSNRQLCCFDFYFVWVFAEPFAQERTCFECDQAVPATGRSWGALKAMYR